MPITEVNLYKSGWLELVFDDRNKEYGAYDLRKHYAGNLSKALVITLSAFVLLFVGSSFALTHKSAGPTERIVDVHMIAPPKTEIKKPVELPKPKVEPPQVQTVKYLAMKPTEDEYAKNPPDIDQLKESVISDADHKGKIDPNATIVLPESGGGDVKAAAEDNEPKIFGTIEVNPEFPGGETAWAKFLQKNLKYPAQAIDAGIGGKVLISFVVEKDGHLSDIKVVRGPGYGLEDEAVRVLKLVPPWKPGIQNGRPVRVMYTMPFSFVLPSNDN
jgi:protein TonB